jgi:SAM-dependent methyltransferase
MSSQTEKMKSLDQVANAMKQDWDRRARENAKWFINTATVEQTESEFDASGRREMEILVLPELSLLTDGRDPKTLSLLEIGCGIGRMTKHFAALFGEVHSTDVSGEMIRQARQRLRDVSNVFFHETSGVDFAALPDARFDAVFSAYVFQHVPDKDVIVSNIREAWRVIRPGGILKLHTNGVESSEYEAIPKDTWAGATFSEAEIRGLAGEMNAQLISIYGAGTGYCWTTLRKPIAQSTPRPNQPRILFAARADDAAIPGIPATGNEAWFSLVAGGLDRETIDANSLCVEFNGAAILPRYAGRIRPHFEAETQRRLDVSMEDLLYIEAGVPPGATPGPAVLCLQLPDGTESNLIEMPIETAARPAPIIFTVRNLADFGTDLYAQGPKSQIRISVVGLDETATVENVQVLIGDRRLRPDFVGFLTDVADYQVDVWLPAEIARGVVTMRLVFDGISSEPVQVEIK